MSVLHLTLMINLNIPIYLVEVIRGIDPEFMASIIGGNFHIGNQVELK